MLKYCKLITELKKKHLNIKGENFKYYYDDSSLLLADFYNWEVNNYGISPNQATQNVKKLTETWKKIDSLLSLQPNVCK